MTAKRRWFIECLYVAFLLPPVEFYLFDLVNQSQGRNFSPFEFAALFWSGQLAAYAVALLIMRIGNGAISRTPWHPTPRTRRYVSAIAVVTLTLTLFLLLLIAPHLPHSIIVRDVFIHLAYCLAAGCILAFVSELSLIRSERQKQHARR